MPKQELDQNLQAACVRMYRVCMYIHGTHASEHRWVIWWVFPTGVCIPYYVVVVDVVVVSNGAVHTYSVERSTVRYIVLNDSASHPGRFFRDRDLTAGGGAGIQ